MTQPTSKDPRDLEAHKNSVASWWRAQSATMAILKHVYGLVEKAEEKIAAQDARITQLENLAVTDPLTSLYNRRGFETFFDREIARIRRSKSPGGLFVLIDLDQFKGVNDSFSHAAGDACIQLVGEVLKKSIRQVDAAARFGGDEFALILTETDTSRAIKKVQAIKRELNSLILNWDGWNIPIGGSVGVEPFNGDSAFDAVYRAADAALYADKAERKRKAVKAETY